MSASNAQLLAAFTAAAVKRSIPVSKIAYGSGAANFTLPKAGVPRYLVVNFAGTLSRTSGSTVGTVVASPFWPYNLIKPAQLIDMSGITRIYATGYHLYALELMKNFGVYQRTNYAAESYASTRYTAAIPAGVASSTVTAPLNFSVIVPVALTKNSALGSYPATVPNGVATLTITESPLTGSTIDFPLTVGGGDTVSLTGNWSLGYKYFDAAVSVPIPTAAFDEVHEVYWTRDQSNLEPNAQKTTVFVTGRTYYRLMQFLIANNAPDTLDVTQYQFLIDSSTPTENDVLATYLEDIVTRYGRDFPAGMFIQDYSQRPWTPNDYGSLATVLSLGTGFTPGSFAALDSVRETLYVPSGNLVAAGG